MYKKTKDFGVSICSESLGEAWLDMVSSILEYGELSQDEGRKRLALQNMRLKTTTQKLPDGLFEKYADKENIETMKRLFFNESKMRDIDVRPSFSPGAKSYFQRIEEGRMYEFIIKRLSLIPESKKAVMVFPTYEDYKQVLQNQRDDYLPCLISFQVRLLENKEGYNQNSIFFMRSWDAFQKAPGNLEAMATLSINIAKDLTRTLKRPVSVGSLDGLITDSHIYEETLRDANIIVEKYLKERE